MTRVRLRAPSQVFPSPVPHLFGVLAVQVCSTLSFSGSGAFGRMLRPFDVVIVDEAAQAVRGPLRPAPQPQVASHGKLVRADGHVVGSYIGQCMQI